MLDSGGRGQKNLDIPCHNHLLQHDGPAYCDPITLSFPSDIVETPGYFYNRGTHNVDICIAAIIQVIISNTIWGIFPRHRTPFTHILVEACVAISLTHGSLREHPRDHHILTCFQLSFWAQGTDATIEIQFLANHNFTINTFLQNCR